ncbi:MAG: DnaJ domain-containing protein [Deltaproteobacteria bacterium]|nr:DnaJ domain-containing protein [Deltaproteobacteria bacterium]
MSTDRLDQLDYYALLEVEQSASVDQIRAAFRKFALKFHPDRHVDGGHEKVERATRIYRRGSEALETLVDPTKRKAYDVVLARGELRLTADAQSIARTAGAKTGTKSSRAGATKKSATGGSRPGRKSMVPGARAKASQPRDIQSPTAKAFYARALQASKAGDYKAALRMIDSALSQEPGHPVLVEAKKRLQPYVLD